MVHEGLGGAAPMNIEELARRHLVRASSFFGDARRGVGPARVSTGLRRPGLEAHAKPGAFTRCEEKSSRAGV